MPKITLGGGNYSLAKILQDGNRLVLEVIMLKMV